MPTLLEGATGSFGLAQDYVQAQISSLNSAVTGADQLLSAVGLGGTLTGTIGAVMANGFNLSCWGSSLNPQKAQERLKRSYVPAFTYLLNKFSQATTPEEKKNTFNEFCKWAYVLNYYYGQKKLTEAGWSTCAKKAINEVYKPFFATVQNQADNILADFITQGATKNSATMSPIDYLFTKEMTGDTKDYGFKYHNQTAVTKGWSVTYPVITNATQVLPVTNPLNSQTPDPYYTAIFGPKIIDESGNEVTGTKDLNNEDSPSLLKIGLGLFALSRFI